MKKGSDDLKYDRLNSIQEYVYHKGSASLDELCSIFEISKSTARRDAADLVKRGLLKKVYGGLKPANSSWNTPLTFHERHVKNTEEKNKIGVLAAAYIKDNDVIFVDSGTTMLNIVPHIVAANVTVLTNNLQVIYDCLAHPHLKAISFGGQLDIQTISFYSDHGMMQNISRYNVNKSFMAATGISIEKGATNSTNSELMLKMTMVEQSDECFLLVDSSKFDNSTLLTYASLSDFQYVITDKNPDQKYVNYFQEYNIKLITAHVP